ncbi:OmpP1/FadL family transporter [Isoalcanivorax indicus]|uniref:OmpP1/FadL family transporter n=1 Tax=Isoalcanivorax indicus TaxID=2202653 RepID=UPI000DB9E1B6|nr:outer membrane protein transport protein [Isoalcanivorax indicus]
MSRIYPFSLSALTGALILASGQSLAGGLSLNEQSASGMGTAYAGRASSALDASTLYGNPAGMSRLNRAQVSGGLAVLAPNVDIKDAQGDAPGTNQGNMVPTSTIPFGYYVTPIDDNWHFGIGAYAPFGGHADYEDTFQGRYQGLETEVRVITVQPTISYRFNDRISVGAGITFNRIDGTLSNNFSNATISGGTNLTDATLTSEGDDYGYGYNLGVMADVLDGTTVGLTYYSKVDYTLEGHTTLEDMDPAAAAFGLVNGRYDAQLDFTTPEHVAASVSHALDERWTLHGGAVWTRWSRLQRIDVENEGAQGALAVTSEEIRFRDTLAVSFGASYQLDEQWILRAGFALDESPATSQDRSVRVPYGHRKVLAIGAGWSPNPDLTLDLGYAYLWESDAAVEQEDSTGPAALRPGYSGTFSTDVHGLSAQLSYRF